MAAGDMVRVTANCGLNWTGSRRAWDVWLSDRHAHAHAKGRDGLTATCEGLTITPVEPEPDADDHDQDWAGPGFTRPGPEPAPAGQALGVAGSTAPGHPDGEDGSAEVPLRRGALCPRLSRREPLRRQATDRPRSADTMHNTMAGTSGHMHVRSGLGRVAAWVARLRRQLSDRMFADADAFARDHGWTTAKASGRFGFGARVYRDPRFDHRKSSDRPQAGSWAEPPVPPDMAPAHLPLPGADPS